MMSNGIRTIEKAALAPLPKSEGIAKRIARLKRDDVESRAAATMLRALIEIAGHGARYTFFVSKMIWGVSLFMECGDWNEDWKTYPRISKAAGVIRSRAKENRWKHPEAFVAEKRMPIPGSKRPKIKTWDHDLTFDHARTISDAYRMMTGRKSALTFDEAAFIVAEYPPVIITTTENAKIDNRGFKKTGQPERRYEGISLDGFTLRA
jgi:hypothetical protein